MEYSEIVYLITQTDEELDNIGNDVTSSESFYKIYAKKQGVKTNEFYNASMVGLTPSCEFVVKRLNYHGESELKWNNERYTIIRTIDPKNKFDIVLVCAKKIGVFQESEISS